MEKYSAIIREINSAIEKFNLELSKKENHVPLLNEEEFSNKSYFFNLTNTLYNDQRWPNDVCRGVYFIFGVNEKDKNESAVYIGKSSFNNSIGRRLYVHLNRFKDSGLYYMNEHSEKPYVVELVSSISLEDKLIYMIQALEEFLIGELKQRGVNLLNSIGN